MDTSTRIGLPATALAALAYVLGWFSGIIVFLLERENRFVRFHALQSIIVFGVLNVLFLVLPIVADILGIIPLLGGIFRLLISITQLLLVIVWVGLAIVLIIAALRGQETRVPYLGPEP